MKAIPRQRKALEGMEQICEIEQASSATPQRKEEVS
jgi:hypothetical protein